MKKARCSSNQNYQFQKIIFQTFFIFKLLFFKISSSSNFFETNDALIQECEAKADSIQSYPTGYGGGIFVTGSGEYDASTLRLDLEGMRIFGNAADYGGQSLYVAIIKLAEWCDRGTAGENLIGNYLNLQEQQYERYKRSYQNKNIY